MAAANVAANSSANINDTMPSPDAEPSMMTVINTARYDHAPSIKVATNASRREFTGVGDVASDDPNRAVTNTPAPNDATGKMTHPLLGMTSRKIHPTVQVAIS